MGLIYFTAFYQDFNGEYYRVIFSSALNNKNETTYSIGDIQKRQKKKLSTSNGSSVQENGALIGAKASTLRISQEKQNVNREFGEQPKKTPMQKAFEDAGKFSREETSLTDLRKENTKLRAQVEYWRDQTKVTDHPTLREGDVKKAAGEILKEYKSTADKTETAKEMQRLGNYIVQSGENVQWDNIKERTHMPVSSPPLFSLEFISPFIYTKTDGNKIVAVCLNITYITAKPTGTGKQEQ
ncbi:MAG: hypothetical protein E7487_08050 [Ruminococcaceae bacterium]|nr:hypothetical protein [Oscillospiraceae bacterium]